MTLLNNASNGDYSILRNLVKIIAAYDNSISKNKLTSICGEGIVFAAQKKLDKKYINDTLSTWQKFGLIVVQEDVVTIPKEYLEAAFKKNIFNEQAFKLLLINILYLPENNKDFWSNEGGGSDDFTRGSVYLFARDIFNPNFQTNEGDLNIILNGNRRSALIRWMYALGLMNSANVADPTILLKSFISNEISSAEYNITDFISELADRYPVLDSGSYRKSLEEKLTGPTYKLLDQNQLSISLSLALKRARNQGLIELINKADSSKITLTEKGSKVGSSFSHIKVLRSVKR
jgi:hypothetical protein